MAPNDNREITITISKEHGYDINYKKCTYQQLMADLIAATIFAAHARMTKRELIKMVKQFWNKYQNVKMSLH